MIIIDYSIQNIGNDITFRSSKINGFLKIARVSTVIWLLKIVRYYSIIYGYSIFDDYSINRLLLKKKNKIK